MVTQRDWKSVLVLLTGFAALLPGSADAGQAPARTKSREAARQIKDVSLDTRGVLSGYLVDRQGKPETSTAVTIRQGRRQIARAKTNAKGHFEVQGLKGGVYQMSSKQGSQIIRVWKHGTAPKKASRLALLVNDQTVVRGQILDELGLTGLGGGGSLATVGIGAAIITGTTIAVVEATDDDDSPAASP
ncbi:MAG: hypothetical protein ACYTGL_00610 [Planctomycetota bacterium]|jgi:hypothetical protein